MLVVQRREVREKAINLACLVICAVEVKSWTEQFFTLNQMKFG